MTKKTFECQVLDGTWVHDVCQRLSVGCKVVNGSHSGFKGSLRRARDSVQWKSKGGFLGLSQEVNEYRTREYHYN